MNPIDEMKNRDASSNIPEKRKRGRPRKIPDTRSVNMGVNAGIGIPSRPPGFDGRNGYLPHHAAPVNGTTDAMIGTVVSGVIDGTFDGGYLLSLRIGNSLSTLRGVVFKPGRYVPVTAENDVAPGVQMTRRNAIPIPAEVHSHVHGKRRSRNVNGASKHQQVLPMTAQTVNPLLSRGNLLPVILQPRSSTERILQTGLSPSVTQVVPLPNGSIHPSQGPVTSEPTSVATQVADVGTSKVQVPSVTSPSDGSVTTIQMPAPLVSKGERNENGTLNQPSTETLVGAESITTRLTDMPFERIDNPSQDPPQSTEIHTEGSESTIDELDNDGVQPLVIEPLQAFFPIAQSTSPSKPPEGGRIGKMSELLQVIQENMGQSEVPLAEVSIRGSSQKLDEAS